MSSVSLKTPEEIEIMFQGGQIAARALKEAARAAHPGVSTLELEKVATECIKSLGAEPAFSKVAGYQNTTCINLNEGIVHGVPSPDILVREGDLLTIDLGAYYRGFYSDTATTVVIGTPTADQRKFVEVGKKALAESITSFRANSRVGDISYTMETVIRRAGYSPVEVLVGHGIGRELHEYPPVPCYGRPDSGIRLQVGLVLAIEVIYTAGSSEVVTDDDSWTIRTADGSWAGLFEHTVALTEKGPRILT